VLATLDYAIIGIFLIVIVLIALRNRKFSQSNTENFFLSGRSLGWFMAGLSMVATTFAADTPLAFTEIIVQNGISGSWLVWNMLIGGMLTAVFFAQWWRKAGVSTDNELIELRYSGKSAAFLRGFKAIYLGVFINVLIIGWVNLAMVSIYEVLFDLSNLQALGLTFLTLIFTAIYTSVGGLKSVIITDSIQFVIAFVICIILAVLVIGSENIGGISGLKLKLPKESLAFFPKISNGTISGTIYGLSFGALFARIGIQWWASYYPGAEPGGGGYIAQRILSTKSEKDATYSVIFFQLLNYCIRPWPWIIVGLATLVLYPGLSADEARFGYLYAVRDFMPIGLKGLMLVAFLAAYMSTISSQLNWGASYLMVDIFERFSRKNRTDKEKVKFSIGSTILLMLLGALVTTQMTSISGVWSFIIECGAGMGMVSILRWFWWRINATAELVATLVPFFIYGILKLIPYIFVDLQNLAIFQFPNSYFIIVGITTLFWIVAMYATPPETPETLDKFYQLIEPYGFWNKKTHRRKFRLKILQWLSSVLLAFSVLFSVGYAILLEIQNLQISLLVLAFSSVLLILTNHQLGKAKKI
jgi:Na+/proline symporter